MRSPFEKLMRRVAELPPEDHGLSLGELSRRWGEPIERVIDAIDAVKVLDGIPTYIPYEQGDR